MDFVHYQSPKLLGAGCPITNKRIFSRKSATDLWRMSDILAKSKIPELSAIFPATYENQAL